MGKKRHISSVQEQLAKMHALYQLFCHQQGLAYIPPQEYMKRQENLGYAQYLWIKHWLVVFEDTSRIIKY